MRSLAIVLVLANLAVLVWGLGRADPELPASARSAPKAAADSFPQSLQLLAEVPAPAVRGVPAPEPVELEPSRYCEQVGSFLQPADASAVLARAESLGLMATMGLREQVFGTPDFQVHLPPLSSPDQARRQVRELMALGVEAYVIERDELELAVSVGLFTDEDNAEARREEVARLGYEVRIRRLERTRTVADVLIGGPDADAIAPFVASLLRDWPETSSQAADCPAIP